MLHKLDACKGETLADQVETYLTETIGVPQEHIDSIRKILIEKKYSCSLIMGNNFDNG